MSTPSPEQLRAMRTALARYAKRERRAKDLLELASSQLPTAHRIFIQVVRRDLFTWSLELEHPMHMEQLASGSAHSWQIMRGTLQEKTLLAGADPGRISCTVFNAHRLWKVCARMKICKIQFEGIPELDGLK